MSRRHDIQDASGIVVGGGPAGVHYVVRAGTPTNGQPGFYPGCLWANKTGTAGSVLYVNTGTLTSATWLNIG